MNIGILGIGGVGGYFGGKLAAHYQHSEAVKVIFIARPETANVIRTQGLKLITPEGERRIYPHRVISGDMEMAPLDVLLCATKSYDLEEALKPLASCITANTLILPLLNGVNAGDTIRSLYPAAQVADGCVYVNAKRISPGVVEKTGAIEKLYLGSNTLPQEGLEALEQIFLAAGIDSHLSANIETDIWTKAIFTAGMATATSYFDESIGKVLHNPEHRAVLEALVREAYAVAVAKSIQLPEDTVALTIQKMEALPTDGTSSMHRDFMKGGKTEYRSLTKHIADLADLFDIDTPSFDRIIPALAARELSQDP